MPGPLDGILGAVFGGISERISPVFDNSIRPWISNLSREAVKLWTPVLLAGLRCSVPVSPGHQARCGGPAVASCICCGQPTCLHHALVAQTAAIVCVKCVSDYMRTMREGGNDPQASAPWVDSQFEGGQRRTTPGPQKKESEAEVRSKHLRTLGLEDDAGTDEIKEAYRKAAQVWHPDRAAPEDQERYRQKFLRIQAAYEYLSKDRVDT